MKKSLLFIAITIVTIALAACQKESTIENTITLEVELKEFTCNSNLFIVDVGVSVTDFQGLNPSNTLYSDIEKHNDGAFKIGDILTVEFVVLENKPYTVELVECTVPDGIQVEIIAIE